jgi:hypothetical protein
VRQRVLEVAEYRVFRFDRLLHLFAYVFDGALVEAAPLDKFLQLDLLAFEFGL